MRFNEHDMNGPYPTEDVSLYIDREMIGVYVLSYGWSKVDYVGRSDNNLQARLRSSNREGGGFKVFWFCYESSPMSAFRHECKLYHKYEPDYNLNHPDVPDWANWRCPVKSCEWS